MDAERATQSVWDNLTELMELLGARAGPQVGSTAGSADRQHATEGGARVQAPPNAPRCCRCCRIPARKACCSSSGRWSAGCARRTSTLQGCSWWG